VEVLTKEEKAWIKKVEKLLLNPPSNRMGLYTIGDPELTVYDLTKLIDIHESMDSNESSDFCVAVDKLDARLGGIKTKMNIMSTAG